MSGTALRSAAAWLLLILPLHAARADNIAATVTTPGGASGQFLATFGWSFTPAVNMVVTQLGVLDLDSAAPGPDGDGLDESHAVGLWTAGGTLLVSATVPAATAATLANGTRFVGITPTPLSAGQTYIIGAYYLNSEDHFRSDGFSGSVFAYDPLVAPGAGRYGINQFMGLEFPGTSSTGVTLGPNFTFTLPPPTTRTWPTDPAPCNDINDLAACVNGANHGDTIEIAADVLDQTVNVAAPKSFTLRPAAGFSPTFGDSTTFVVPAGNIDETIVIEGLIFGRSGISVGGYGPGLLDLTLRNNVIRLSGDSGAGIVVFHPGRTTFDISNNAIEIDLRSTSSTSAISFSGLASAGNVGRISGNRIHLVSGFDNNGIELYTEGPGTLDLDVIGNQIWGTGYLGGVSVFQSGTGHVTGRIVNNVISGQVNGFYRLAAISLNVDGGSADYQVINNTVAFNETGISFKPHPELGATATALISNNIVAFNTILGMDLEDFTDATINDFNLVHGNGLDLYLPGPGTLTVDPLFLDPSYLHPRGGSPAFDSGSSSRMPADITTDAAGNDRIIGIIDRGAFESGAGGSDLDHDGIADGLDNCTLVPNVNQRDTDGDGYGNICDADLNNTGLTTVLDFNLFRGCLNLPSTTSALCAAADMNGSGLVTVLDFNLLRGRMNTAPGPSGLHP